jgi:hypothetical protein
MNIVNLELDAYDISRRIFSNDTELNNNFSFENMDIRTLFEMLLIIFTEGLKKYNGNEDSTVNINELTDDDIRKINVYLQKIGVKVIIDYSDYFMWNLFLENKLKLYNEIDIDDNTKLKELKYIFKKDKIYIINFDYL